MLEALQRRSSDVWEAYREQLAANPDAIELPQAFIDSGWVRASGQGAEALEVTAGPAQGFYERVGFTLIGAAQTRFGPAVRMRRDLQR